MCFSREKKRTLRWYCSPVFLNQCFLLLQHKHPNVPETGLDTVKTQIRLVCFLDHYCHPRLQSNVPPRIQRITAVVGLHSCQLMASNGNHKHTKCFKMQTLDTHAWSILLCLSVCSPWYKRSFMKTMILSQNPDKLLCRSRLFFNYIIHFILWIFLPIIGIHRKY